ncbi:MAG: hypothetical protein IPJ65_33805 [Archangiaceae bacterium]|nr:hypothetical protein [Archangiaceae bacterium]
MKKLFAVVVASLSLVGCGGLKQCTERSIGGAFCIPDAGVAPAGQALTFQIVDGCTSACSSGVRGCVVSRDGGHIDLTIEGMVCQVPGAQCTLACGIENHTCELGPLPEGDYTITSPSQAAQTLHVGDAGVSSCAAPPIR